MTIRTLQGPFAGETERFAIVGVDEAQGEDHDRPIDPVAFTAPIAQALLGKGVGERAEVRAGIGVRVVEIVEIARTGSAGPGA